MSEEVYPQLVRGLGFSVLVKDQFSTLVQSSPGRYEIRIPKTRNPIHRWTLIYDYLKDRENDFPPGLAYTDLQVLQGFYLARGGRADSFLFYDWTDVDVAGNPRDGVVGPAILSTAWQPDHIYVAGDSILDSAYHWQLVTSTGGYGGISGLTEPTWNHAGGSTTDGTGYYPVNWEDQGIYLSGFPNVKATLQLVAADGISYSPVQILRGGYFYEDITDLRPASTIAALYVDGMPAPPYTLVGPGLALPGYSFGGLVVKWTPWAANAMYGIESLTNGALTTPGAEWVAAGDFTLAGGEAVYSHSTGAGSLKQPLAGLAVPGVANRWYQFKYTVSDVTPDLGPELLANGDFHDGLLDWVTEAPYIWDQAATYPACIGAFVFTGAGLDDAVAGPYGSMGAELLTNGDFHLGLTGWTVVPVGGWAIGMGGLPTSAMDDELSIGTGAARAYPLGQVLVKVEVAAGTGTLEVYDDGDLYEEIHAPGTYYYIGVAGTIYFYAEEAGWEVISVSVKPFTSYGGGSVFTVEIDGTGPDTFKWRRNSGSWVNGVPITGAVQTLTDGFTVTFGSTTGHTLGDSWASTLATGWSIGGGGLPTSGAGESLFVDIGVGGSVHQVTIVVAVQGAGTLDVYGGFIPGTIPGVGTFTDVVTTGYWGDPLELYASGAGWEITSISVKAQADVPATVKFSGLSYALNTTAGTHSVHFEAQAPVDFVISATSTSGAFTLDALSLIEDVLLLDSASHLQQVTDGAGGLSGMTDPIWDSSGGTTSDNDLTWTDLGVPTVTADFDFYYRVRFDVDEQEFERFMRELWTGGGEGGSGSGTLEIIQLRGEPAP